MNRRADSEQTEVREAIKRALEGLDNYLEVLNSIGSLPALHPSLEHRDTYHRHLSEEVASAFEKARAASVLLQLVPQSVLLYGRKAIHHVFGPEGEVSRMETQLGSHGTKIEDPLMTIFDPLGLNLMLLTFRHERTVT